jgi:hypothetical protein
VSLVVEGFNFLVKGPEDAAEGRLAIARVG